MSKIWNLSLLCLGALVLIVQTACSDNDSDSREVPQVVPTAQWSQTMAGNGETLGAYPDLYSNYWEFTYRQDENSDKIICIKGQYPYCRYMSFSFYNDETGDVIGGLDDINIHADAGSTNPFKKTISGKTTIPSMWYLTMLVKSTGQVERRQYLQGRFQSQEGDDMSSPIPWYKGRWQDR